MNPTTSSELEEVLKILTRPERQQRRQQLNELARKYYWEHRKKLLDNQRKKYHTNEVVRQHKCEYGKRYRRANIKKILAYQRVWRARRRAAKLSS